MFSARSVTGGVALETALSDPDAFVAVTLVRQVEPMSTLSISTSEPVGSGGEVAVQPDPSAPPPDDGQRSHWYVNDVGELLQVPCVGFR
jgi:hypothetical protein